MTGAEKIEMLETEKAYMLAHGGDRQVEALTSAIKALKQEPKWIPVEQQLPKKGKQVLCCNKHSSVFTSAITYIEKYKDGNKYVCFGQHHDVIAWMPLPEPYREDGDTE